MKDARVQSVPVQLSIGHSPARLADYAALTKPRLNALVVATSAAGYYLGASIGVDLSSMIVAVVGTALVAGGAAALNQLYERETDALMIRTRTRPLPDGRVHPSEARVFGILLAAAGLGLLALRTNVLATALAASTLVIYLAVYTPMKRRSPGSTLVGAIPGALPPLIGWTASHGSMALGGAALFFIVFLWQIPHFMAIAWLYRDDYARAGFPMLPVIDPTGNLAGRQAAIYAAGLLPVSLVPAYAGLAGPAYLIAAIVLGSALLWLSFAFARRRTDRAARALFVASLIYLPLIWIVMILDKI